LEHSVDRVTRSSLIALRRDRVGSMSAGRSIPSPRLGRLRQRRRFRSFLAETGDFRRERSRRLMQPLGLFSAFGVELEYMLVDARSLDVRPICDLLLQQAAGGEIVSDIERGAIGWSNELALHVVELKTNGPARDLAALPAQFQEAIQQINGLLEPFEACLLPTGMHPWMDPHRELRLWPHDYGPVYETFHRVFDCRGHGWANLQSTHLNLPFADDDEFGRLHAAVRLILPLLPGLAASSPAMDGRLTGLLDTRLEVYRTNARRIRSVSGRVIPEPAYTRAEYDRQIFQPMYREIEPFDPDGVLQEEFLNARGAIARFGRGAIEIRVLDVQESPEADIAICAAIVETLRQLVAERWQPVAAQQAVPIEPLEKLLLQTIRTAEATVLDDPAYLAQFGAGDLLGGTVSDLWRRLVNDACLRNPAFARRWGETLHRLLTRGVVARAIAADLGDAPTRTQLHAAYEQLARNLPTNRLFQA